MPSIATQLSEPVFKPTRHWQCGVVGALALLTVLLACRASAQSIYRSVATGGQVTFSDKPLPAATKLQPIDAAPQSAPSIGPALPFALRHVVSKYPVTLYTAKDCAPCDSGRNLLQRRGVPFAEKTVITQADVAALQRLSGSGSIPFLTLGGQQIKGYSDVEWAQYLSAAGYPEQSQLPPGFRSMAAVPLVPVEKLAPAKAASAADESPTPAPPPVNRISPENPAGIQF